MAKEAKRTLLMAWHASTRTNPNCLASKKTCLCAKGKITLVQILITLILRWNGQLLNITLTSEVMGEPTIRVSCEWLKILEVETMVSQTHKSWTQLASKLFPQIPNNTYNKPCSHLSHNSQVANVGAAGNRRCKRELELSPKYPGKKAQCVHHIQLLP